MKKQAEGLWFWRSEKLPQAFSECWEISLDWLPF
jgi:hypothetical protein